MLLLLAQSAQDISSVPADDVKSFFIMLAFVLGLAALGGGGYILGKRGTKADPIHVHQPVKVDATTRAAAEHAHQSELDELRALFENERQANMEEHKSHRAALAAMLQQITDKGNSRELNIINAINEAKDSITAATLKELKDIHNRINPLAEKVGEHSKAIEGLGAQLKNLWEIVRDALRDALHFKKARS